MLPKKCTRSVHFMVFLQSRFRSNQSTNLCLAGKIMKGFEEGLLTEMILINLQKEFDAINYIVFLQKRKAILFSEQSIQWFRFCLCEQIFLVKSENKLSDFGKISCRVHQGIILEPLLFFIYLNDIPQAVKSNLLLYADNSCLTYEHKGISNIKKYSMRTFKIFVTSLLIINQVLIFGMIKLDQFFSQVSKGLKIFVN